MKRALMVAAVSAALIATQAAASSATDFNAGDRIGGTAQASNQFVAEPWGEAVLVAILASGVLVLAAVLPNDHSDEPISP